MVHHLGRTVCINNFAIAKPLFKLIGICLAERILAVTDLDLAFLGTLFYFLTGATGLYRDICPKHNSHTHIRYGIPIVACIDHRGFKCVGIKLSVRGTSRP